MSILIKGMEMPKHCRECCLEAEGYFCWAIEATRQDIDAWNNTQYYGDTETRPDWCPLVPVPEHGRLIDADALDDILADQSEDAYNRTHAPRSWEKALSVMRDYLEDSPTIIPADKEGEG